MEYLGNALVADRGVVGFAKLLELWSLVLSRGVQPDGNRHQTEVDRTFPDSSSHNLNSTTGL